VKFEDKLLTVKAAPQAAPRAAAQENKPATTQSKTGQPTPRAPRPRTVVKPK
jgi:hypothetical protein